MCYTWNRDVDINAPLQSLYTSQIPLNRELSGTTYSPSKVLSLRTITRTMIIYPNFKYTFATCFDVGFLHYR